MKVDIRLWRWSVMCQGFAHQGAKLCRTATLASWSCRDAWPVYFDQTAKKDCQ